MPYPQSVRFGLLMNQSMDLMERCAHLRELSNQLRRDSDALQRHFRKDGEQLRALRLRLSEHLGTPLKATSIPPPERAPHCS